MRCCWWHGHYLCRHALELYLKDALPLRVEPSHNLKALVDDFRSFLHERLNTNIPARLRNDLYTLASIDPDGQRFAMLPLLKVCTICARRILGATSRIAAIHQGDEFGY